MGTFISAYYIHFLQYLARFCQELVLLLHITTEPVELPCYATLFLQMLYSNRPQSVPASIDLEQFQVPRTKLPSSFAYFFTVARQVFIGVPLSLSSTGYPGHATFAGRLSSSLFATVSLRSVASAYFSTPLFLILSLKHIFKILKKQMRQNTSRSCQFFQAVFHVLHVDKVVEGTVQVYNRRFNFQIKYFGSKN